MYSFSLSFIIMPVLFGQHSVFVHFTFLDNFTLVLREKGVFVIVPSNAVE